MGRPKSGKTAPGGAKKGRFNKVLVGYGDRETGLTGGSMADLIQRVGSRYPDSLRPTTTSSMVLPRQLEEARVEAPTPPAPRVPTQTVPLKSATPAPAPAAPKATKKAAAPAPKKSAATKPATSSTTKLVAKPAAKKPERKVWIDAKDLEEESASRTTTASDVAARAAAEKAAADAKDKAARDAARRAALDEDSWDMPQPYRY